MLELLINCIAVGVATAPVKHFDFKLSYIFDIFTY